MDITCNTLYAFQSVKTSNYGVMETYSMTNDYQKTNVSLSANRIYTPNAYITDKLTTDDLETTGTVVIQDNDSKCLYVGYDINDPGLMFSKENMLSNKSVISCNNDIEFQINNNTYMTLSKNFGMVDLNTTELNSGNIYTPRTYSTNISTRNCSMWSCFL
jgi:hypothetical protein